MTPGADWTAPGAHPVAPGVHRIPLPLPDDGLRAVNVYAVDDGDHVTLIDGGWALLDSERALGRALRSLGRHLTDVRRVLVTHLHRDHYTQAIALRRRYGTTVALGAGERPGLAAVHERRGEDVLPQVDLLIRAGAAELARTIAVLADRPRDLTGWEDPDLWLDDRVEVALAGRTLRAVATPGHTRGHVVFHDEPAGILFAGDHVLPHITPSLAFEPAPPRSPLASFLASLELVRTLPDAVLLPAHGPAGMPVHQRVDELLAHHEARLHASLAALDAGARTATQVAGRLAWTGRKRQLIDLDPFNQMLAILETAAHLELLVERGHLRPTEVDGVRQYSPPQAARP